MRRLNVTRCDQAERGATAVLVALLMTVLLGFLGLAIDLGASFAKHTELQNGADAGALALAQEYATAECVPNSTMATVWVQGNVNNEATDATGIATCLAVNKVKVESASELQHWFMPILGKDSSSISADATVEWGVPVAGGAIPLAISNCRFEKYFGGDYVGLQQDIWMEHPNDPEGNACVGEDGGMPSGGFSWIDTVGDGTCGSQVVIDPDGDGGWAGSDPGVPPPNDTQCKSKEFWQSLIDQDDPVYIPIFDYSTDAGGGGENAEYHITQFASFDLVGMYMQSGPASGHYGSGCIPDPDLNYKNCISGRFIEFVTLEDVGLEIAPPTGSEATIIIKLID